MEAFLLGGVLLAMVVLAPLQALLRKLSEAEWGWAISVLGHLDWVDTFLQIGTLWLAFLGASLATFSNRHLAIDILPKILPRKAQRVVQSIVNIAASVVCVVYAYSFFLSISGTREGIPAQYSLINEQGINEQGEIHICEASSRLVESLELDYPHVFCAIRHAFQSINVELVSPESVMYLAILPFLIMMSLRFLINIFDYEEVELQKSDQIPKGDK